MLRKQLMTPLIAASKTPLEKALPHEAFRLPFGEEGIPVSNHLVMATVAAVIAVIVLLVLVLGR